jgi:hypothetical protein
LKDIQQVHVRDVLHLLEKQVGKEIHLPYGIRAVRTYEGISLEKISLEKKQFSGEVNIFLNQKEEEFFQFGKDRIHIYLLKNAPDLKIEEKDVLKSLIMIK